MLSLKYINIFMSCSFFTFYLQHTSWSQNMKILYHKILLSKIDFLCMIKTHFKFKEERTVNTHVPNWRQPPCSCEYLPWLLVSTIRINIFLHIYLVNFCKWSTYSNPDYVHCLESYIQLKYFCIWLLGRVVSAVTWKSEESETCISLIPK